MRIIGGLEMVRHNNNLGFGIIGLGEIENSRFHRYTRRSHCICIYVNSDVTNTFTFEFWFC